MALVLLVGGARSGKSSLAQEMAERSGLPVTVIATGQARDDEMARRIAAHRADRPADWTTVEEPADIEGAIAAADTGSALILDCLTLWVSNRLLAGDADDAVCASAVSAADAASARAGLAVAVSNEVGSGIVPDNALARRYADLLGRVNAIWAARADRCALVVAGRVLELAPAAGFIDD